MRITAFLKKRDQADVIEKILRHCGLWERPSSRLPVRCTQTGAPPEETEPEQEILEYEHIPFDDFGAAQ